MVRVQRKSTVASVAFAVAIASMAGGSSAGQVAPSLEAVASEVGGLVVKVHGTHRACRHGSYGRMGMQVGWHRHDRGATYPCAPESTGAQPYSPSTERGSRQGSAPGTPGARTGSPSSGQGTGPKTGVTAIPKIIPPGGAPTFNRGDPGLKSAPSTTSRRK
jgi:hypothetical protein